MFCQYCGEGDDGNHSDCMLASMAKPATLAQQLRQELNNDLLGYSLGLIEKVADLLDEQAQKIAALEHAVDDACKPWQYCTGDPPEYESPLQNVWQAAIGWMQKLVAKNYGIEQYKYEGASETLEGDSMVGFNSIIGQVVERALAQHAGKAPEAEAQSCAEPVGFFINPEEGTWLQVCDEDDLQGCKKVPLYAAPQPTAAAKVFGPCKECDRAGRLSAEDGLFRSFECKMEAKQCKTCSGTGQELYDLETPKDAERAIPASDLVPAAATPETDALWSGLGQENYARYTDARNDLSCKLERERNEARAALEEVKADAVRLVQAGARERADNLELRAALAVAKEDARIASHAVPALAELRAALEAERKKQWCPHMTDPDGSKINCGEYIGREIKAREAAEARVRELEGKK